MKKTKQSEIRQKVEEHLRISKHIPSLPVGEREMYGLLHELQVHQIELEMQNEELQAAQREADAKFKLFSKLYDELEDFAHALHESEWQLQTLVSSLDDIIFELNAPERRFTKVWCADPTLLFMPPKEFLGKTIVEALGNDFAMLFESAIDTATRAGVPERIEYQTPGTVSQTRRWFEAKIVPLGQGAEQAARLTIQVSDITERKLYEQRQAAQYKVAKILAESFSFRQAAPRILAAICEGLGWDCGTLWEVHETNNSLRFVDDWSCLPPGVSASFTAGNKKFTFERGISLPGTVWKNNAHVWISDIGTTDIPLPRIALFRESGFRSLMGFPISIGGRILCVMEFLSCTIQEADPKVLVLIETLSRQIAQFLKRKEAENKLQMLSMVASKTTNAVVITDADGYATWVNEGFTNVTEYSAREVIGRKPGHLLQGSDTDTATVQIMRDAIRQGAGFDVEILNYTKSGRPFWVHIKADPISEENGVPSGYIAIQTDITERKRQEQELRLIHDVVNLVSDRVAIVDKNGKYRFVNDKACKEFGLSREELLNSTIRQIAPYLFPSNEAWKQYFDALRQQKSVMRESMVYDKNGSGYMAEINTSYICLAGEEYSVAFVHDISERKKMEKEIFRTANLLSNVINATEDLIFVKDTELRTILCNNAYSQAIGKKPEEIYGRLDVENGWLPELVHGNPTKGIRGFEQDDREALSGTIVHNTNDLANVGDKVLIFDTVKVPLYDETGTIMGILGIARDVTEQRRMEEQQLQKLSLVASKTTNVVIITDAEGCITWVNEGFTRLTEYSLAEVIGNKPGNLLQGTDTDRATIESMRNALRLGIGFEVEILNYTKSNRPYWLHIKTDPLYDSKGALEGFVAIETDITARKKVEAELLNKSEEYRNLVTEINEGIYALDTSGIMTFANPALAVILGVETAKELIGKNFLDFIVPNMLTTVSNLFSQSIAEKKTIEEGVQISIARPDGQIAIIQTKSVINLSEGNVVGVRGVARDITKQKKLELEIKETNQRLQSIITSMSDGVILVDAEQGTTVLINPAMEIIFGYSSDELLSQPLTMLIPPIMHDLHKQYIQGFLKENYSSSIRYKKHTITGRHKSGNIFPIEASIAHFMVEGRTFLLAVVRDITQRLESEEEILQLNRTLVQRVEERTAQLVMLNKEKDEFLGIATHDLKNPIAVIRSSAQIIAQCFADGDAIDFAEYADSIIVTCDHMLDIIANFLDIELIESGQIGLAMERLSLATFLGRAVETYQKRAAAKDITIHFTEPEELFVIIADRMAIKQVLDNLLSNAIKFSPRSSNVTISLYEKEQYRERKRVRTIQIAICDEGPGIEEDEKNKLFTKFSRLSAKPTGEEGSTGLGLSIVKKLVEIMYGRVWCESVRGEGATFIVELPLL